MNRLKETRFGKGKSQLKVYLETGIWPSRISEIENGHRIPTESEKVKLANALEVEKGFLFPPDESAK